MRLGLSVFIVYITLLNAFSQSPTFSLDVDHDVIALDQYIEVTFTLHNGQGKVFTPPDFAGWTLINGLSTSSQVSIINGARSSSISYNYTLAPKSIGDLVIGKALIQVNGITLSTSPKKIKVTKSAPNSKLTQGAKGINKKDIFIIGKAIPDQAYVGQQILVEYKLYTAINVDNYNIAHAPDFNGFHVNNTPRGSFDNQEFFNGRRYVTKVIHTASIYPIQSGSFDLDALHARASVVTDDASGDPNSFFLLPTTQGVDLVSNTIAVKILSLPQPAPDHFSGAVGRYKMAAAIDQTNVKVNDAISLTIYIEGDGDLNRVGKPFINSDSTAFQYYEPKITKEKTDFRTTGFIGMRELIYPLVASKPGTHKIIPSFIYFDTDSQRYVTSTPQVYNINISGTAISQNTSKSNDIDHQAKVFSIIQNPRLGHSTFVGSSTYFILLILPLMTWIALFINHKMKHKHFLAYQHIDQLNQSKATALKNLAAVSVDKHSNTDTKSIIENINDILKVYLRKKWSIEEISLSNDQWNGYIDRASIGDSLKLKIKSIFSVSEFALYGGQMNTAQLKEMMDKAKDIIEKI